MFSKLKPLLKTLSLKQQFTPKFIKYTIIATLILVATAVGTAFATNVVNKFSIKLEIKSRSEMQYITEKSPVIPVKRFIGLQGRR